MQRAVVCPGDRIGSTAEHKSGPGTYEKGSYIYSSLVGPLIEAIEPNEDLPTLTVRGKRSAKEQVLEVGDIVVGRISGIKEFSVNVEIMCLGDNVLRETYNGIIRKEDVRSNEVDKVTMLQCFRPGDIVKARVISLGNVRQYFLSTAGDELGVRWAKSQAAGAIMIPIDWQTMQCPISNTTESRKCAKPD